MISGNNSLSIINGRVIDPASGVDQQWDVHISDGCILSLGTRPPDHHPHRVIDARGQIVCPGLVDLRARMCEPGLEHKATIASESHAAASGGITTLCTPPDTMPPVDTPAVAEMIRHRASEIGLVRVHPLGALTAGLGGEHLSEMAALKNAGCTGTGNACRPMANTLVQRRAMEYAATFGLTVHLNPEDPFLGELGCAHEGTVSTRLGLPGIPEAAETVAVARDLALAAQTGARVHFCGLSTGTAVRMIARAREDGLKVSADVCAHQLHLTEMDLDGFDSRCHVRPPLRTLADRDALRRGVADGTIVAVCSDHQPHDAEAKTAPFPATAAGISALETLLPLTLRLVGEGVLDMVQAIDRLTAAPAAILQLDSGTLQPGRPADICVFDPSRHWRLTPDIMVSRGRNTPFTDWEFTGLVTHTLLDGKLVYTAPNTAPDETG
jgi:dihydroorotase